MHRARRELKVTLNAMHRQRMLDEVALQRADFAVFDLPAHANGAVTLARFRERDSREEVGPARKSCRPNANCREMLRPNRHGQAFRREYPFLGVSTAQRASGRLSSGVITDNSIGRGRRR